MAEPLKNQFSRAYLRQLGLDVRSVHASFDLEGFLSDVLDEDWPARTLQQRMRHITLVLARRLPRDCRQALAILVETVRNRRLDKPGSFVDMVFPDFVEVFGLEDFDASLEAMEWFTRGSSSEFAVRPFIARYGSRMMDRMVVWSRHPNEHVRRLASEGCRPRLPWAMALVNLKLDPSPILPVLENLKADPSEYAPIHEKRLPPGCG
jgi:hypothetical protein